MKTLNIRNKGLAAAFAFAALAFAATAFGAVTLKDVTAEDGVITIGVDSSFPKYEGWIPWLKPYATKDWGTDEKAVIWKNRKLSDIKGLKCKMGGSWIDGDECVGRGLITSRTDERMEVQFQTINGPSSNNLINKAVLAYLEQSGDDIVIWARNAGSNSLSTYGTPIPDSSFYLNVASCKTNAAYGVFDIEVLNVLETTPAELKAYAATVGESGTGTLQVDEGTLVIRPTQTNDVFDLNITGNANVHFAKGSGAWEVETLGGVILQATARTILPGLQLRGVEVVSAKTGGSHMAGEYYFQIYHLRRETGKVTFQAQTQHDARYTKCVLVELADGKAGVEARIVWGRYTSSADCPLGTDFSTLEDYSTYITTSSTMQASLSSLVLKVEPTLVFASSKSAWTTWGTTVDGGLVRVTNEPMPANPLTFVANGGSLRLDVKSGAYNTNNDAREYVVSAGSELVLAGDWAVVSGASLTIDGGSLLVLNPLNYVNSLVITNGGEVVGSAACYAGFQKDATWRVSGTDSVTIEPGIQLVNGKGVSRTVTLDAQVETFIPGALKDANKDYLGATFAKEGPATLTLGGENGIAGPFKVVSGELVFANAKGIKAANAVILSGGSMGLAQGVGGVAAGALTLDGSAALDATNGTFSFADSHGAAWAEGAVLTLKCGASKKERRGRFRFGTDANGLTAAQLAAIRYDESVTTKRVKFTLDDEGYLTDNLDAGFAIRIR